VRKWRAISFLVLGFAAAILASDVMAAEAPIPSRRAEWFLTGSGSDYVMSTDGDVERDDDATVSLASRADSAGKFGATAAKRDAAPFIGKAITLSADLTTRTASEGAGIWVRADGANGVLAFQNSQDRLVVGDASDHRTVRIVVPDGTKEIVFGVILLGNGEVRARHVRLTEVGAGDRGVDRDLARRVLDAAIVAVRENALRAGDVDWVAVEPKLRAMASGAERPDDVYPAIHALLVALNDHHSFLMSPYDNEKFNHGGSASFPATVEARGAVGYIRMPSYSGADVVASRTFARTVVDGIATNAPLVRCGWIIDLRDDEGGNMWPMLAALSPFLGDEPIGAFRGRGDVLQPWRDVPKPIDWHSAPVDLTASPVAVLTGRKTASSGEAVAIAFRGRARTRSFGTETAGLTSANAPFALPDGSMLMLATSIELDRTGRAYESKLAPDEVIGDARVVAAATQWLENLGCGALTVRGH
jgi:peptidase S41-like protein